MNDKEVIEIITSWVALTKKIDRWCIRFNDMQQRAEALFQENIRLRKRIKELENGSSKSKSDICNKHTK